MAARNRIANPFSRDSGEVGRKWRKNSLKTNS
jgi:hypothetical protein